MNFTYKQKCSIYSSWTLSEFTPRYRNLSSSKVITFHYISTCLCSCTYATIWKNERNLFLTLITQPLILKSYFIPRQILDLMENYVKLNRHLRTTSMNLYLFYYLRPILKSRKSVEMKSNAKNWWDFLRPTLIFSR